MTTAHEVTNKEVERKAEKRQDKGESFLVGLVRGNSFTPALSILVFFLIWEAAVRLSGANQLLMPPPTLVFARLLELLGPGSGAAPSFLMFRHIGMTLFAMLSGFVIASIFSSALGLLMGMNRIVYAWLNPIISLFMVIPNIAFVPIIVLWLGLGLKTVITVVVTGACFPIIYTAAAGVRNVPTKMIWAAQTAGASRFQILRTVLIGATMPYLIEGHRLGLGLAWRAVIAGEIFASTKYGVGFLIYDARTFLDTAAMFSGIMVVGIIGVTLQRVVFGFIERRTVDKWGVSAAKHI
ncbi:ABC transporter permease [Mesorhizobium sp. Cs1299R1N3]|uniref:ABC transporter permease n=1 Tax=Mesorhizobium sp. Cs1299R1N3 TaxID=3015173 RepID=UPI00301C3EAE